MAAQSRDSSTATVSLESKIPQSFRLSLSYPNPSLGQMAFAQDDVHGDDQKKLKSPAMRKQDNLSKGSRAVLIVSWVTINLFSTMVNPVGFLSGYYSLALILQSYPPLLSRYLTTSMTLLTLLGLCWLIYWHTWVWRVSDFSKFKSFDAGNSQDSQSVSQNWATSTAEEICWYFLGCCLQHSLWDAPLPSLWLPCKLNENYTGRTQLTSCRIVCRSFQGIGASGLYSLTQISLVEVGPVDKPSLMGAMIGATLAVAFVLGPIIGGLISQLSDWRWLFNMK